MFKSVEYVGFDGQSELKAQAEELLPLLAKEIRTWQDDLEVRWTPNASSRDALTLTLALMLPNGVSEIVSSDVSLLTRSTEKRMTRELRRIWMHLLDRVIRQLDERVWSSLLEPVEA